MMKINLTKKQLSKLMDYFYKCEEVAQYNDEQPKWTKELQNIHWKLLKSIDEAEEKDEIVKEYGLM